MSTNRTTAVALRCSATYPQGFFSINAGLDSADALGEALCILDSLQALTRQSRELDAEDVGDEVLHAQGLLLEMARSLIEASGRAA